jgi:hypothetical protein
MPRRYQQKAIWGLAEMRKSLEKIGQARAASLAAEAGVHTDGRPISDLEQLEKEASKPLLKGRIEERRLNPFIWVIVSALTAAAVTIAIGVLSPVGLSSPLLLGLPFLAVVAIAMLAFMQTDRSVRRRSLLEAARSASDHSQRIETKLDSVRSRLRQRRQNAT